MNSLLEPKSKKLKKSLNHRQSNHNILKKLESFDGGFWKDEEVTLEASTINHLRQLKRDQADVSIPKQESTKTHVSILGGKMKDCCWAVAFMQCRLTLSGKGHGTFTCMSLLDQISLADFFFKNIFFAGENLDQSAQ